MRDFVLAPSSLAARDRQAANDDVATIRNGVGMIIEPRVRGFICTTAHPAGCATNVREQIAYVLGKGAIPECPKRVAGGGLLDRLRPCLAASSRPSPAARTPSACRSSASRPRPRAASAGWYNNRAFEARGRQDRPRCRHAGRRRLLRRAEEDLHRARRAKSSASSTCWSTAWPRRSAPIPDTGKTYRSAIKPLGAPVDIKTLNTDTGEVYETDHCAGDARRKPPPRSR